MRSDWVFNSPGQSHGCSTNTVSALAIELEGGELATGWILQVV